MRILFVFCLIALFQISCSSVASQTQLDSTKVTADSNGNSSSKTFNEENEGSSLQSKPQASGNSSSNSKNTVTKQKALDYTRTLGFGKETQLDKDLEGHEYYVETFSVEHKNKANQEAMEQAAKAEKNSNKNGNYVLQFATIANFDDAQSKKYELSEKYGISVVLRFDPPFYKLQGGHYNDKQKAEDRAADLRDNGISAFVVKMK